MKITLLSCIFTLATPISIFIGRETEITSEKAFVLGRMKVTVTAKETPGKRGFVFIKQLDDEWKIKWTECTQELRSQVSNLTFFVPKSSVRRSKVRTKTSGLELLAQ